MKRFEDNRIVLTLDAGGSSFRFSAIQDNKQITPTITLPTEGSDLVLCLANIVYGFKRVMATCPAKPSAISFAFPGPADYPNGIIGDLGNLPCFRGGVALGPMLEDIFALPVFINNDGDLFAYGEAIAGLLPYVNNQLEKRQSPKRYKNLLGVTLGTGLGGGIVQNDELFLGDNSIASEVWLLRNKLNPQMSAEEGACIRAVRRAYARGAGIPFESAPEPHTIEQIATGRKEGHRAAAVEAYRSMGEVVGDVLGNALTLIDGLAVIGGGLSKAGSLFLTAAVDELNSTYITPSKNRHQRLAATVFNLEDPSQMETFLTSDPKQIAVPRSNRKVSYDPLRKIGVGLSRLGTSEAVAVGAYVFALRKLDHPN